MGEATGGIVKRSLSIAGHRTSVSLEEPFWVELGRIARLRGLSVQALVTEVDSRRDGDNLSSALRLHVLQHLRDAVPWSGPPHPPSV